MANISIMDALTRVSKTIKDYVDNNNLTDNQMNAVLTEVFGSNNGGTGEATQNYNNINEEVM